MYIINENDTVKIMYGSSRPKSSEKPVNFTPIPPAAQDLKLRYTKYPVKYPTKHPVKYPGHLVEDRGYTLKFNVPF